MKGKEMKTTEKPEIKLSEGWTFKGYCVPGAMKRDEWFITETGKTVQFTEQMQVLGTWPGYLLMVHPVSQEEQFERYLTEEIDRLGAFGGDSAVQRVIYGKVLRRFELIWGREKGCSY